MSIPQNETNALNLADATTASLAYIASNASNASIASNASNASNASIASSSPPLRKVLVVTYYWPPSGGAGVQRWLKFSKYLPEAGWQPVILTVDPEYAAYPATDLSLEKDVPAAAEVHRTKTTDWFRFYGNDKSKVPSAGFATNRDDSPGGKISRFIRGNFFIPDPRRGWNKHAFRKACELIEKHDIRNIITTSPPHSSQLIGLKLKKKYPHLRWLADLRDPWTDIYYYNLFYPTLLSRKIDSHYEKAVLAKADIITTVGPTLGKIFSSKMAGSGEKIKIIHNGFDEEDFSGLTASTPERFTISYTGTISESYPVNGFIMSLKELISGGSDLLLKFTGHIPDVQKNRLISELGAGHLEFIPYSDHRTVIGQMLSASMLLLVLAKDPGNRSFLPGKLFEYIASGKPVVCLGPTSGDTAAILNSGGYGRCFDYDDQEGITEFISGCIKTGQGKTPSPPSEFSRRNLAMKVAQLLD